MRQFRSVDLGGSLFDGFAHQTGSHGPVRQQPAASAHTREVLAPPNYRPVLTMPPAFGSSVFRFTDATHADEAVVSESPDYHTALQHTSYTQPPRRQMKVPPSAGPERSTCNSLPTRHPTSHRMAYSILRHHVRLRLLVVNLHWSPSACTCATGGGGDAGRSLVSPGVPAGQLDAAFPSLGVWRAGCAYTPDHRCSGC